VWDTATSMSYALLVYKWIPSKVREFVMATYSASVRRQGPADTEHCSADPERLATIGRARGQQVRIKRSASEFALYTVSETRQESPDKIVRLGDAGLLRLGTSAGFTGTLDSQVPHPAFNDAEAEANSEFVERLKDNGAHKGLIAIAPHGGNIEQYTDQQAERVAAQLTTKGVSAWRCKGWRQGGGAYARWHITSTDTHQASFPRLKKIIARGFTYAVAFHGFSQQEVLIGGTAPEPLKQDIKSAIEGAVAGSSITVRIAQPGDNFGGDNPRNVVNRLTAGGANGIQIEQSFSAREDHWQAIADAVAGVYDLKLP
jgi:phage replication-related protein YjqB (UPF0714/DUF867 family)